MLKAEATYRVFPLKMESCSYINYSYVILDLSSGQAAVVDPTWNIDKILAKLDEIKARLTTILLTHSHFDHVNLVSALLDRFKPEVFISRDERDYYNFSCGNLSTLHHLDVIRLGKTAISYLLTPGHTAGGGCYLLSDCIFTGDTLFIEGCGSCGALGGSPEKMFESIQLLKRDVRPKVRVFPGHCFGSPPGCELEYLQRQNLYFQFDRKDQFVEFRMRKGQNDYLFV